jgi:DNA-binding MarR family transcriptional regulator
MATLVQAVRENSTATVLFHTAVAERLDLSASDLKTLELIQRLGRITAGDLGRETGLTSASVTALIDRLERKGFTRRTRDATDRRKVFVEPVMERFVELGAAFGDSHAMFEELLQPYTIAEIELLESFLRRATALVHRTLAR